MQYKTCRICGAHLDPGERCDCDDYDVPEVEMAQRGVPKRQEINRETFLNREAQQRYRKWLMQ